MHSKFSVEDGELIIKNIHNTTQIIWQGRPLDCSVEYVLEHSQQSKCFALLSRKDSPKLYPGGPMKAFNNLVCIDSHGKLLWRANLPGSGADFYTKVIWSKDLDAEIFNTDINLQAHSLVAFSYSGYLVNIDPEDGEIISKLLIK